MKKLICMIAVIALICTLSTTAFAVTLDETTNSDTHDVFAKFSGSVIVPDVYSVDVTWGAMEFTYSVSGTKEWDALNHNYSDNLRADWTANGNTVSVTNHSNKAVTATFEFAKDSEITEAITGSFSVTTKQLDAGEINGYATADKVISTLTIDGALDTAKTDLTKVGSVTVTIQ